MISSGTLKILGYSTFGVLLLLAAVFCLERIGHIDMAFQTFLILKSGSLEIQSGRFGAAVTQAWPWAAQALHLPLRGVLLAYSIGHVAWPLAVFAWCCWLGARQWAAVLLLLLTGMSTHTFYWLSEMPQGLVFLVGLMAYAGADFAARGLAERPGATLRFYAHALGFAAAVATAFYFHPLLMYALVFACGFVLLGAPDAARRRLHVAMLALLACTVFVKYRLLRLDWYDAVAVERAENFRRLWPHWLDLQSHRDLLGHLVGDYWFVAAAWLLNTAFFFWKKRWLSALWVGLYPIGYVFLVNVPYHESTHQFYMENLWLPLGFFAAVPLVLEVLPGCASARTAAG
ncbi:MAG TPA: hypothetical protein PKD78_12900, partial [Saprospiraceae bacterium]|nr:hypothetical protein [Saprospiraceae bacterium]